MSDQDSDPKTDRDPGILPNSVNRDVQSEVALIFGTLTDGIDELTVQQWLTRVAELVHDLESHQGRKDPYASAIFGLGVRFFTRFPALAGNNPHGLAHPPNLPVPRGDYDFFLHVTFSSEAKVADFLQALWGTRPILSAVDIERGYSRNDGREAFGQLDGLRNLTRDQRARVTAVDRRELPEEPVWLDGGCYAAYLKIEQNTTKWVTFDLATREQIVGRRTSDGSRLDLEPGHEPKTETEFLDPSAPSPNSHVRKTGPRGLLHDQNLIFRRGVPYVEEVDNALHFGLQLVSYQASLADFDVVLNRWMLNPDFPHPGAGVDALVSNGLVTFQRGAVFVIVPHDDRFPGAGYFDPNPGDELDKTGRIHIRKTAVDQNGTPVNAEVGGIEFQLIDATTGAPIGESVRTNPAGRAALPDAPLGASVLVRETPTDRFEPATDLLVPVDRANVIQDVINRLRATASAYGG